MEKNTQVKVGDYVRSFDFPHAHRDITGPTACYVEGRVVEIGPPPVSVCRCPGHYHIAVERAVFAGEPLAFGEYPPMVFPPLNGTKGILGVANGVEVIPRGYCHARRKKEKHPA